MVHAINISSHRPDMESMHYRQRVDSGYKLRKADTIRKGERRRSWSHLRLKVLSKENTEFHSCSGLRVSLTCQFRRRDVFAIESAAALPLALE